MKKSMKIAMMVMGLAVLPAFAAAQEEIGITVAPVSGFSEGSGAGKLSIAAESISAAVRAGNNAATAAGLGQLFTAAAVRPSAPVVRFKAPGFSRVKSMAKSVPTSEASAPEAVEAEDGFEEGGFLSDGEVAAMQAGLAAAYAEEAGESDPVPPAATLGKVIAAGMLGILLVIASIALFPPASLLIG